MTEQHDTTRPGSLRFRNEEGQWVEAAPHDALFSTVTMCATEYYAGGQWKTIFPEELKELT